MATAGDRHAALTGNIWAYAHRGDMTGLKAAVARGVNVNLANTVGWTACHAAAAGGHPKALKYLAKCGASLEETDRGGNRPAHQAAQNGHLHALQTLHELGADVAKVRLSQAKGAAVRDYLTRMYQQAKRKQRKLDSSDDIGEEDLEDDLADDRVGYARKQSKSTAFWGPRKTPISGKIKKKIMKERRIRKKQQGPADDMGETNAWHETRSDPPNEEKLAMNYQETVQHVKRNKKMKQLKKEARRRHNEMKKAEQTTMEGAVDLQRDTSSSSIDGKISVDDENDDDRTLAFSALAFDSDIDD